MADKSPPSSIFAISIANNDGLTDQKGQCHSAAADDDDDDADADDADDAAADAADDDDDDDDDDTDSEIMILILITNGNIPNNANYEITELNHLSPRVPNVFLFGDLWTMAWIRVWQNPAWRRVSKSGKQQIVTDHFNEWVTKWFQLRFTTTPPQRPSTSTLFPNSNSFQKVPWKIPPRFRQGSTIFTQVPARLRKFRGVSGLLGQIRSGLPKGSVEGSTKVAPRFHQGCASFVISLVFWGRSVLGCHPVPQLFLHFSPTALAWGLQS